MKIVDVDQKRVSSTPLSGITLYTMAVDRYLHYCLHETGITRRRTFLIAELE